jgi:hypothetical protein
MTRVLRHVALVAVVAVSVACSDRPGVTSPTAPAPMPVAATPVTPPPPVPLPPLSGRSTTYEFSAPLGYPVSHHPYTTRSAFVVYENGYFQLLYRDFPHWVIRGSYKQDGTQVLFYFDSFTTAVGTLKGSTLEVRYSDMMIHSDFENAVYQVATD